MTKQSKKKRKRQQSRKTQVGLHEQKRLKKALAEYNDSFTKDCDDVNWRSFAIDGKGDEPVPQGPDYKRKLKQKND
jgi:hypothetical protein